MIKFTKVPESTRYCSACGRNLVLRQRWTGRYDERTGELRYEMVLRCPVLLLPLWYRMAYLTFLKIHDEVQVWEPSQPESRPVSRPYVPPSEDTR